MSKSYRRYEVLLPLQYNDARPVPEALVAQTLLELRQQFSAVSWETQIIRGFWKHRRKLYRDELVRVFVDIEDSPNNQRAIKRVKARLLRRFKQIDIWVTSYPIDVL